MRHPKATGMFERSGGKTAVTCLPKRPLAPVGKKVASKSGTLGRKRPSGGNLLIARTPPDRRMKSRVAINAVVTAPLGASPLPANACQKTTGGGGGHSMSESARTALPNSKIDRGTRFDLRVFCPLLTGGGDDELYTLDTFPCPFYSAAFFFSLAEGRTPRWNFRRFRWLRRLGKRKGGGQHPRFEVKLRGATGWGREGSLMCTCESACSGVL